MDIGFSRAQQMTPPQVAGGGGVSAPGTLATETSAPGSSASTAAGGWTPREVGSSELARVTGEERVDEAALRRDDDLGNLVSKAFDPQTAAAALPPLGIGENNL